MQSRGLARRPRPGRWLRRRVRRLGQGDFDLLVRLLHAGVRRKDGAFATGVLHLWHPDADRSRLAENESRLDSVVKSRQVKAEWGLSSLRR